MKVRATGLWTIGDKAIEAKDVKIDHPYTLVL